MMRLMTVPFNEIEKIYRQIDRAFDESDDCASTREIQPPVELKETAESLILRAMLPGIDREQLNIEVTREAVLISGTYPPQTQPDKSAYFRSEFPRGQFRRVVSLPFAVDNTAAQANYEQGILTLTLPKVPEVINKVVKVSVLDSNTQTAEVESVDNPWDS